MSTALEPSSIGWVLTLGASSGNHPGRPSTAEEDIEPIAMISSYLRARRELSPKSAEALEDILRAAYNSLKEEHGE